MNGPYANSFLSRLAKNRPEDNIELARDVREMVEHPGWGIVMGLLAEYSAELEARLETGTHEHAVYAARVSERKAMKAPLDAAAAIIEQGSRSERDLQALVASMAEEN